MQSLKADFAEVKVKNSALQIQLDSQREWQMGYHNFKHIRNELNHVSNLDLIALVTKALTAFELGFAEQVDQLLHDYIKHLLRQNKFIKLADGSPTRWGIVTKYVGNYLAEDDRGIRRADNVIHQR
jgi:hypothetical protein